MPELLTGNPSISVGLPRMHPYPFKHMTTHHHIPLVSGKPTLCDVPGLSVTSIYLYSTSGMDLNLFKIHSFKLSFVNKDTGYSICPIHISGPTLMTEKSRHNALVKIPYSYPFMHKVSDMYDIIVDCEHTYSDLEVVFAAYNSHDNNEQQHFYAQLGCMQSISQTHNVLIDKDIVHHPLHAHDRDRACHTIVIASTDGSALQLSGSINTDGLIYPINDFEGKHLSSAPDHCYILQYGNSKDDHGHIVLTPDTKIELHTTESKQVYITYFCHDIITWMQRRRRHISSPEQIHPISHTLTHPAEAILLCIDTTGLSYELPAWYLATLNEEETIHALGLTVVSDDDEAPSEAPDYENWDGEIAPPDDRWEPVRDTDQEISAQISPAEMDRIVLILQTIVNLINPLVKKKHTTELCAIGLEPIKYGDRYTLCPQCGGVISMIALMQWMATDLSCPKCRFKYTRCDALNVYVNCSYGHELLYRYGISWFG